MRKERGQRWGKGKMMEAFRETKKEGEIKRGERGKERKKFKQEKESWMKGEFTI